jgi:transposase
MLLVRACWQQLSGQRGFGLDESVAKQFSFVASLLLRRERLAPHTSRIRSMPKGPTRANLSSSEERTADAVILKLKTEGRSFREIAKHLGKSLGSVTGRYYRLKGVRHPSQIMRDAELRKNRKLRRTARDGDRSMAAIQAAIELRSGVKFSAAIGRARAMGASFEMIGACCGVSKQALHKKWRQQSEFEPKVG